ncbi:hypothetical protein NQ314_018460 [Rhamnusium bicolor]|uniref:C2H2-type domain-containing protein n=1 Tax=Rhamnusium bicolor TaxID=1586634 RepID=A0AAV8WQV1_9CUCU|nr:hypothetical protein NQ314_018460 [Rhamnusium bicolor]
MNTEQCSICLEKYYSTVSVDDSDEYNVKWFTKLQFIVPELEWLEEYQICESCKTQLEKAWGFKKLVLNLEAERRLKLEKRETYLNEENIDFKDNCDIEYYYEEKGISCEICSTLFTTQTQLQQHKLQIHSEDSFFEKAPQYNNGLKALTENEDTITARNSIIFTCYDCSIDFITKKDLLFHVENEHDQSNLCVICEKSCPTKTILQNHMRDEHKIEIYKEYSCSFCPVKFESEAKLTKHASLCSSKFQCSICTQVYSTKKLLNAHIKLCKNKKRSDKLLHQCHTCKNFYTTEKNLNLHKIWCVKEKQENDLGAVVNHNCDICVIKFDSVEEYNSHNISKHNPQKRN